MPRPYTCPDDVFCLQETRISNGYGCISLFNRELRVANGPLRKQVGVHLIPTFDSDVMTVRIWCKETLTRTVDLPLKDFGLHL